MRKLNNMNKCPNCGNGSGDYIINITTDGYKEYKCKYCGTILNRINLLDEYKELNVEHAPFSTETDLNKLIALRDKYNEDLGAVGNFINFLDQKRNTVKFTNDEYVAINRLYNEFYSLSLKLRTSIKSICERIGEIKRELAYNKIKQLAINEYDPTKKYKSKLLSKKEVTELIIGLSIVIGIPVIGAIVTLVVAAL